MDRYEIRVYKEIRAKRKGKGRDVSKFYGVWDNKINNWVVNSTGFGKSKVIRILRALAKNENINKPKPFWREK